MEAVIECRDEDTGLVFRWHGGAYIDVGYIEPETPMPMPGDTPGEFHAEDVINVWDDEHDISYIEEAAAMLPHLHRPFRTTLELFEARCREYLAEATKEVYDA